MEAGSARVAAAGLDLGEDRWDGGHKALLGLEWELGSPAALGLAGAVAAGLWFSGVRGLAGRDAAGGSILSAAAWGGQDMVSGGARPLAAAAACGCCQAAQGRGCGGGG